MIDLPYRRIRRLVVPLLVAALPGCFTYQVIPAATQPAPDAAVQARITARAAERLGPMIGNEGRVLEGRVIQSDSSGMLLEMPSTPQSGSSLTGPRLHQRIRLAPADIVEIDVRRLDTARTAALIGAGVIGAAVLVATQLGGGEKAPINGSRPPVDRWIGGIRLHF